MVLARAGGFIVSILQARLFSPSEFGEIQYYIALANVIAVGTVPFGQHVLARYISKNLNNRQALRVNLSSAWIILTIVYLGSLILAIPILAITNRLNLGVFLIFSGVTVFYAYWGVARGYLASGKLAVADLGNNLVQILLILLLIQTFNLHTTLTAMAIQGLACLVPLLLLQVYTPLPLNFDARFIQRAASRGILRFSIPIWFSHGCHMLSAALPLIFLEFYQSKEVVGVYSLALTLSLVFSFVPNGIATLLMPRIVTTPREKQTSLLASALVISTLLNGVLLVAYLMAGRWLIERFFGVQYLSSPGVFLLLAVAMILAGMHSLVTALFVGCGRASDETYSRFVAALITGLCCWLLVPGFGALGAALAMVTGISCSLAAYVWIAVRRPLSGRPEV